MQQHYSILQYYSMVRYYIPVRRHRGLAGTPAAAFPPGVAARPPRAVASSPAAAGPAVYYKAAASTTGVNNEITLCQLPLVYRVLPRRLDCRRQLLSSTWSCSARSIHLLYPHIFVIDRRGTRRVPWQQIVLKGSESSIHQSEADVPVTSFSSVRARTRRQMAAGSLALPCGIASSSSPNAATYLSDSRRYSPESMASTCAAEAEKVSQHSVFNKRVQHAHMFDVSSDTNQSAGRRSLSNETCNFSGNSASIFTGLMTQSPLERRTSDWACCIHSCHQAASEHILGCAW